MAPPAPKRKARCREQEAGHGAHATNRETGGVTTQETTENGLLGTAEGQQETHHDVQDCDDHLFTPILAPALRVK
jgi:hypothetical protein